MVKASKFCHITPILTFLHWLKINERIEYKRLSLTHKALTITQLLLHSLISDQPPRVRATRSVVTLSRPPTPDTWTGLTRLNGFSFLFIIYFFFNFGRAVD